MSEKTEKIFVDGMRFEKPNEKAPEWVKGKISIKADKLIEFIEKHKSAKGWLNIDLKKAKSGALYLELNTWASGKSENPDEEIKLPIDNDIEF